MIQALSFALNLHWLRINGVIISDPTCFIQGYVMSIGDLASGMFITLIAGHTYLSVVHNYQPPQKWLYTAVWGMWFFVFAITSFPIWTTHNGREHGGYFVRAGHWCWISSQYEHVRIATHFSWLFAAVLVVPALYITIVISLRKRNRQEKRQDAELGAGMTATAENAEPRDSPVRLNRNRVFLLYPVVFLLLILPMTFVRIILLANYKVPSGYWEFAGAALAANGFFDCLVFGSTRHVIVFGSKYDVDEGDTGLQTFAFMQTPAHREFGNFVWIQGGGDRREMLEQQRQDGEDRTVGGWFGWPQRAWRQRHHRTSSKGASERSVRSAGIEMGLETSVVVEHDQERKKSLRFPDQARLSSCPSLSSAELEFMTTAVSQ